MYFRHDKTDNVTPEALNTPPVTPEQSLDCELGVYKLIKKFEDA